MPKKPSKKTLKNKLDKIVSEIVKNKGCCERCYKKASQVQLQTAHIFSRSNLSVRWDLDNVLCLCASCHINFAHKNPIEFAEFVKAKLGETKYEELKRKANTIKKWSDYELQELYENLEKIYKENNK